MRIYTLSMYDEYGAEELRFTTDKGKVPALLESYNGVVGPLGCDSVEVDDYERTKLAEALAKDVPGRYELSNGWGGFQLHIADSFFS